MWQREAGTVVLRGEELPGRATAPFAILAESQVPPVPTEWAPHSHDLYETVRVRGLVEEHGVAVDIVLHDLDHASRVADTLVLMRSGRVHAAGPPVDVLTTENIGEVYDIRVEVEVAPVRDTFAAKPDLVVVEAFRADDETVEKLEKRGVPVPATLGADPADPIRTCRTCSARSARPRGTPSGPTWCSRSSTGTSPRPRSG